jgi:hypothetical protein
LVAAAVWLTGHDSSLQKLTISETVTTLELFAGPDGLCGHKANQQQEGGRRVAGRTQKRQQRILTAFEYACVTASTEISSSGAS